jgi:hypothetical protein
MLDHSGSNGRSPHADGKASADCSASLAELYKAFKAMTFYPEGHPLRDQILHRSHQALVHVVAGGELSLQVGRAGLSVAGEEDRIENNRLIQALARELFARELQRLTISPDVSFVDFTTFLSLLSLEPQRIIGEGGLARLLTQHGVSTIVANGIDIAAVFTRRTMADASEEPVDAVGSTGEASAALSATGGAGVGTGWSCRERRGCRSGPIVSARQS